MISNYVKTVREKVGHMPMFSPVVTLILYKDGKVLLQKRQDNGTWAIHGGGIDPGETYIEALNREIKEELNIVPVNPVLFGIYSGKKLYNIYPNKDEVYVLNHVFFCEEYDGNLSFNDGEVLETKWFRIDELPDNILGVDIPMLNDIKHFLDNGKTPIVN